MNVARHTDVPFSVEYGEELSTVNYFRRSSSDGPLGGRKATRQNGGHNPDCSPAWDDVQDQRWIPQETRGFATTLLASVVGEDVEWRGDVWF
jgi:hypothetical protein